MARRLQGRKICVATSVLLMVGFCAVLGIVLWQVTYDDDDDGNEDNTDELGAAVSLERRSNDIRLVFSQYDNSGNSVLTGYLAQDQPSSGRSECQLNRRDETNGQCYQWDNGPRLEIYEKKLNQTIADFKCYTVKWDVRDQDGVTETPEDCFDMDYHWFGGFETNSQIWPVNDFQADFLPYITSDAIAHKNEYGDVVEPIFWSSSGVGIYIEETSPLYVSINHAGSKQLCLKGKVGPNTPFFSIDKPYLQYDICKSSDITSLWKNMAEVYFPKPKSYPSLDVIRYPIWCTWASYKRDINQSTVLDFARTIRSNNFSISQLEIDDEWSPHYGDMVFNTNKFPDAKAMIDTLTQMGIPATIWVHWFFNNDSDAFQELKQKGYLVKEYDSDKPHLVSWWNGQNNAGVIDVTNPDAIQWYLDKLSALQQNYNITSFKFDAGEVKWIIGRYKVKNDIATPNYMTLKYAEMTYEADKTERRQEMRAGFRSQASSIMTRMLDRDSNWSHDLGLKTLIPCALTFGLMGYPYVLADMIGGNAYGQDVPEPEIFIRWLQATVFMPILQFSLTPWSFNNQTVLDLTSKYIKLHEQYADKIINLTLHAQKTGEPINRPLWWIAPDDEHALTTDSQFLLGDDLMVAPILDKGATSRDIYLPKGLWHDELRDVFVTGGQWLRQYRAELDELPYFTKVDEDNVVTRLNDAVSLERHGDHIKLIVRKDDKDNTMVLTGSLAQNQPYSSRSDCQLSVGDQYEGLCYQWDKGPKLEIYQNKMASNVQNFECVTVKWDVGNEAGVTETPEDCFDMDYYWFGGFEEDSQIWPVNDFQADSLPYITGDAYHNHEYGDLVEPIFWSSSGVGIYIEETSPLYVSINHAGSKQLCLKGKVGPNTPFFNTDKPYLQYDICKSPDITSLWKNMAKVYLPKPKSYPSLDVIRYPIWCTWASYKKDINQTTILDFARTIRNNNFSISQLEIDDEWSPHYGDMVFNTNKFPDAKAMITTLTQMGIPATIWVHWFFNNDSDAFQELKQKGYLVKEYDSDEPHLVSWWNGQNNAGVIDVTNPDAVQWYLDKIAALQQNYNITSFKFDAGEVKWIIGRYKVKNDIATPNYMTQKYAEMTYEADKTERRQELRAGFRSQASSIMTRMLDRDSNWSHDLGLKTLIPCTLTFGLMGYPYVLADLIGGNAYGQDVPEPEIFIRWLQATVFMPILQFSLTPWSFNNQTVLDLTSKYIKLHEQYADKIINLTLHAQKTGEPINRPLWWIAPDDENALTTDSQFLLGDDLMVAPILDKGATSRDIYLPKGLWHDELRDVFVTGGQWLRQYRAELDELPYFTKVDEDIVITKLNDAVSLERLNDHIRLVVRKDGKDNTLVLTGSLAQRQLSSGRSDCQLSVGDQYEGLCYQWDKGPKLEIYQNKMASNVQNFECVTVKWDVGNETGVTETPEDCFNMDYYWFGGFEEDSQIWPVNDFQADSLPYITGDAYHTHDYGDVVEPIFWSSSGVGIYIEETSPLYVSINHAGSKQLCLKGKVGPNTPFFSTDKPYLQYDICKSPDITSLWKNMAEVYLPKPKSYPSLNVIRYPIWCTWASYKSHINQSTVLDFARTIRSNNFSISQLEIDDDWTPHYGDMTFNTNKFPDAKAMIATLTQMGIPATIWVHWFFNNDSDAFQELKQKGYLVKEYGSDNPYLVSWWNGQNNAGVIDVTNPDAVQWYLDKLTALQQNYNITSFKFDAGEIKWIPGRYKVKNDVATPNYISQKYAEMTYEADKTERRQELRTGFRSQASSIVMRMLDRDSNWSHDLALKTLIPCALTFGLMGYPYVLPDMIGGNAYGQDVPEPEIFIRWLQATVFMPILQFSLTPWSFNNQTVLDLTSKYIKLHEQYADKIINLTLHAQKTGEPINRPLWWIAPDDENALTTDSQFLLGDDLLVAPVLDQGATSRDIYLPKGLWYDELRNNPVSGGQWLRQYRAELHELPYFTKMA